MEEAYPAGVRLAGKVALITGGARGLGESFARAMVAQGAKVVVADVLDTEGQALVAELGDSAAWVHLDVTDRGQWTAAIEAATTRFGTLNVLVNNAGIVNFGMLGTYTTEQWDRIVAVNLTGAFTGITAALEELKRSRPSSIINISSTAGLHAYPGAVGYVATKWGLRGLTKAVALELAPFGVRCNSVHPGVVATPMTASIDTPQTHVAMHRVGVPSEIAHLVVYLASDESSYSTGSEFVADGGEMAGLAPDPT